MLLRQPLRHPSHTYSLICTNSNGSRNDCNLPLGLALTAQRQAVRRVLPMQAADVARLFDGAIRSGCCCCSARRGVLALYNPGVTSGVLMVT